jgi:hypothetical protein
MPSFVSLDVLGEDAKSLFAHSLCTHKFFLRSFSPYTPRSLGVYGEEFDEIGEKKEHFRAFSMYGKFLTQILHLRPDSFTCIHLMHQNSLHAISIYAKICYANM